MKCYWFQIFSKYFEQYFNRIWNQTPDNLYNIWIYIKCLLGLRNIKRNCDKCLVWHKDVYIFKYATTSSKTSNIFTTFWLILYNHIIFYNMQKHATIHGNQLIEAKLQFNFLVWFYFIFPYIYWFCKNMVPELLNAPSKNYHKPFWRISHK